MMSGSIKQEALQLSSTSFELIDIAKRLATLAARVENPTDTAELQYSINRLLDIASRVSASASSLVV